MGFCDLGMGSPELGHVLVSELVLVRGRLGLPIERDLHFKARKPCPPTRTMLAALVGWWRKCPWGRPSGRIPAYLDLVPIRIGKHYMYLRGLREKNIPATKLPRSALER